MLKGLKQWVSDAILRFLSKPTTRYAPFFGPPDHVIKSALVPGDVVLIEGNTRISAIIKFLTQSTWSHAALFVGERAGDVSPDGEANVLLEAQPETGVTTVPLSKYSHFNLRICRPAGLNADDRKKVVDYALKRRGLVYDTQQIVDLARYLFPYPPVPVWFRRRMLAVGAGDPTKAICSTLIAESFQSILYPILPELVAADGKSFGIAPFVESEIKHIRKHGLYTPRDFDISPYFLILKPGVDDDFDHRTLTWEPPNFVHSEAHKGS